jgi:hypothetical protein
MEKAEVDIIQVILSFVKEEVQEGKALLGGWVWEDKHP